MEIVSSYCPTYTATLKRHQLWCFKAGEAVTVITVRDATEAKTVINYWSVHEGSVQDAQRFYDIHLRYPDIKMNELYYSADRKTICHQGQIIAYEF